MGFLTLYYFYFSGGGRVGAGRRWMDVLFWRKTNRNLCNRKRREYCNTKCSFVVDIEILRTYPFVRRAQALEEGDVDWAISELAGRHDDYYPIQNSKPLVLQNA